MPVSPVKRSAALAALLRAVLSLTLVPLVMKAGRVLSCGGSHAFVAEGRTDDFEPEIDIVRHLARVSADVARIEAGQMADGRKAGLVGEEKLTGLFGERGGFVGDVMGSKRSMLVQLMLIETLVAGVA